MNDVATMSTIALVRRFMAPQAVLQPPSRPPNLGRHRRDQPAGLPPHVPPQHERHVHPAEDGPHPPRHQPGLGARFCPPPPPVPALGTQGCTGVPQPYAYGWWVWGGGMTLSPLPVCPVAPTLGQKSSSAPKAPKGFFFGRFRGGWGIYPPPPPPGLPTQPWGTPATRFHWG